MKIDGDTAAIVTGGASGLGRASAEAMAAAGARVSIFDINEDAGNAIAKQLSGTFCHVDITNEDSVLSGYEKARSAHGQERILVHCAQVSRSSQKTVSKDRKNGGFKRFSTEDYEYSTRGILVASYRLASIAALGMAQLDPLNDNERGVITLTSSAAAQDAQMGQISYGSCKAGVNGLVLPMARDLMDLGIRVNAIMPGVFSTPPMLGLKERAPDIYEKLENSVPFPRRLGKPEEFSSLALELIRNSYLNGQCLRIDGAIRMPPK